MTEFLTLVKKYGATGVLALWLWHTEGRLSKVETALYDCYKEQTFRQSTNSRIEMPERMYAILPNDKKTHKRNTQARG